MPHSNIPPIARERAKVLRAKRTRAEDVMWKLLRGFRSRGARFRRETPIGPYTADFAWLSAKVVVEVDGDSHATLEGKFHDLRRDAFMAEQGYRVIRFENPEVMEAPDSVLARLEQELEGLMDVD
jgi:very-short-patch-repair endonuclease